MADQAESAQGSATAQAELWGERARDWADVLEGWNGWGIPIYRHVLERVPVDSHTSLLDVGCGAGRFCRIAADRGAQVAGIDATEPLVEIARERVLDGDFRVGEMEELPWADNSFDVITGFNSFFIASDMVNALREVGRVARPGAGVAMTVFGRPERCESTPVFATLRELISPPASDPEPEPAEDPAEAPAEGETTPALHEEGGLESVAKQADLTPREGGYFEIVEEYPDLETMVRGYLAAAPMRRAARMAGEERVRETLSEALRPLVGSSGRPRLRDELRYLIAEAYRPRIRSGTRAWALRDGRADDAISSASILALTAERQPDGRTDEPVRDPAPQRLQVARRPARGRGALDQGR